MIISLYVIKTNLYKQIKTFSYNPRKKRHSLYISISHAFYKYNFFIYCYFIIQFKSKKNYLLEIFFLKFKIVSNNYKN